MKSVKFRFLSFVIGLALLQSVSAQLTPFAPNGGGPNNTFTYQGSLKNNGVAANGNFDFQFALFTAQSGGSQIGSTLVQSNLPVTNGIFTATVSLDFLLPFFNQPFLEVRVRPAGGGAYTVLTPRQQLVTTPYSIKSYDAASLGGIAAQNYITTSNGGGNFIQNQQSAAQTSADFWISGRGSANILNAGTEFQIAGTTVFRADLNNIFVGRSSGISNTSGHSSSFFGASSGRNNTTGSLNSFFGLDAGVFNTSGSLNSFFGTRAGERTTTGSFNSFFGASSGNANTTGTSNAFFGHNAGQANTTATSNSFFGVEAGYFNTTGSYNSFFGNGAGIGNNTGSNITLIGTRTRVASDNLYNATAIGAEAQVSQSSSLVLGSINGVNGAISDTNVGIGTTAPGLRLDVVGRSRFRQNAGDTSTNNSAGFWFFQNTPNADRAFVGMENDGSVGLFGNSGGGWGLVMNTSTGVTSVRSLGSVGTLGLCRNTSNEISTCSSSLRYKTNINPFADGLSLINQLQPITFDWIDGGMHDVGFGAEDVAAINPLFVSFNDKGEVEGVKYDRLSVAFVNAFKEQQIQISEQNELIKKQQTEIDSMKKFLCSQYPAAEFCR